MRVLPPFVTVSFFTLLLAAAACSSDDDAGRGGPGSEAGAPPGSDSGTPPPGNDSGTPPPGSDAGRITATLVTLFDPAKGELPEGIAIRDGAAYVGFAPLGTIVRVDLSSGAVTPFGKLPAPVANESFMTGLAFDANGALYAAMASFTANVRPGIYRIGKDGGDATLFAEGIAMRFLNGLVFDASGVLWATDSDKGAVYRIASDGTVKMFSDDDLLEGQRGACGAGTDAGFDIGANGLALGDGVVYVANSDKATIVEIAIKSDGTAGSAKNIAGPSCDKLGGADGLVRAPSGSLYVAANRLNQIVRVEPNGSIEVRSQGAPLDFPASLSLSTANGASTLWITSFALANANAGTNPKPALVKLAL